MPESEWKKILASDGIPFDYMVHVVLVLIESKVLDLLQNFPVLILFACLITTKLVPSSNAQSLCKFPFCNYEISTSSCCSKTSNHLALKKENLCLKDCNVVLSFSKNKKKKKPNKKIIKKFRSL